METKSVVPTTVVLDFTATAAFSAAVAKGVNQHIIDANIDLVSLAKKSGIPRQTLQRRLSGHAPFTVPELAALAAILGKRPHDFLLAAADSRSMKQYLTAAEFAARARLHLRTVQDMAARGEIEAIRVGGPHSQLRISEDAAQAWEASRRKASA